MIQEYIDRVELAIKKAIEDKGDTKLPKSVFQLEGMSSREGRIFQNEILQDGDKYLEIGVYKGSTFVSSLYGKNITAVSIDNFSQFDETDVNKKWFDQNCEDHNIKNFTFLNKDCFNITNEYKDLIKCTNVYFYDGEHRHEDQEMALTYYADLMTDPFIFIVDDWNHDPSQTGTRAGLEKTNLKVHKEWELTTANTKKGWHNGLYVAVLGKQ